MTPEEEVITNGFLEDWPEGSRAHFEYLCCESHDSADAQLWYRSHQQVTVLRRAIQDEVDNGVKDFTFWERCEEAAPATYAVRFDDGFEGTAMEDELLTDSCHFQRPNPPQSKGV